jgi:hypothetical protein
VFVKIIEKAKFPGFRFFRRGEIGAWPSQETASGEKAPKSRNSVSRQSDKFLFGQSRTFLLTADGWGWNE